MEASRRELLISSLCLGLGSVAGLSHAQVSRNRSSLGAVLDTMLPEDSVSPSASAIDIDSALEDIAAANPLLNQLFDAALGWMDTVADRPFGDLPEETRIEILNFMEAADFNQIPGRFFHIVRIMACELYYSRGEAISDFPLNAAPQPLGYPPPWT